MNSLCLFQDIGTRTDTRNDHSIAYLAHELLVCSPLRRHTVTVEDHIALKPRTLLPVARFPRLVVITRGGDREDL